MHTTRQMLEHRGASLSQYILCKYGVLVNSICYSLWHEWLYQQKESIRILNSLLSATRTTLLTKYGASASNSIQYSPWHEQLYQIQSISKLNLLFTVTWVTVLSNCTEVSVSLSCLFVHEPPYQTVVVCCNPFLPRFFMHEPPYQVPTSVGLTEAHPNNVLSLKWVYLFISALMVQLL